MGNRPPPRATARPPALPERTSSSHTKLRRPERTFEREDNTLLMQGVRVGKKFELIRGLGDGGIGKVWLAQHVGLQRRVALKVLHKEVHAIAHHRERFEREARANGRLHHPGIVEALDFGELEDGRKFLAMEYVEGTTLAEIVRSQGTLPWRVVARIGDQVADALAFAHKHGVVHRDLKPDNLIVEGGDPVAGQVRLLDLGLAYLSESGASVDSGFAMGTPAYSAPEQLRGEAVDARADVYGLGAVLYYLLSAKAPYASDATNVARGEATPAPLPADPNRPPALDALIARMMSSDRALRPASMEEVRAGLRVLAMSLPPPAPLAQVAPARRRVPGFVWVLLGIAVGVLATMILTRL